MDSHQICGAHDLIAEGDHSTQGSRLDKLTQEDSFGSPLGSSSGNPELRPVCSSPRGFLQDSSHGKGYNNKSVSSKLSSMRKSGLVAANSTTSVARGKGIGTTITVCRTEKDTIVHTDSSNFREVVRQLTGASNNVRDLLPVTGSSWGAVKHGNVMNHEDVNGCSNKQESVSRNEHTGRSPELGPRKPMPTKLFERRRSSKTLGRISTSCKDLPSLVPSPVTPLASDFERICLPVTPITSPISSSVMPAHKGDVQMHLSLSSHQYAGNGQWFSGNSGDGMSRCAIMSQLQNGAGILYSAMADPSIEAAKDRPFAGQCSVITEEQAMAEKGFFLHPQMPKTNEPTLLPLFPESPRDIWFSQASFASHSFSRQWLASQKRGANDVASFS